MNELHIFNYDSKEVRTVLIDGVPFWVAKDVCEYFGDTDHKRSVARLEDTDKHLFPVFDCMGRTQTATCINESGLYCLLFNFQPEKGRFDGGAQTYPQIKERIEKIQKFKKWITSEVLPSIRKTGQYGVKAPQNLVEALKLALEQAIQIEEMKPKALEHDLFIKNDTEVLIGDVAKCFGIKPNTLHKMLRDAKIMKDNHAPFSGYEQYFKTTSFPTPAGNKFLSKVYPSGISYIAKRFKLTEVK